MMNPFVVKKGLGQFGHFDAFCLRWERNLAHSVVAEKASPREAGLRPLARGMQWSIVSL